MPSITTTLVGFPPLQARALKGTFIEQDGNNTFAGTNTFSGANTFTSTLTATGTTQINTLKVGTSGTVGAFNVFPATAAKGSIRILAANSAGDTVTTITNASQTGAATYTIPDAGTSSFVMTEGAQTINGTKTIPAIVTTNIDAGASGTAGTIDIFPTTASKGKITLSATANTNDDALTITNAAQGQATTLTIPDVGASTGSFVMDKGTSTVAGAKTFTLAITPTGGVAAAGGFSAAPRGLASQGQPAVTTADGNNSTPSTTETYITSMFVPCNMTITGVKVFNGSDVTGNIRIGLANAVTGAPIAAALTASTAGSGTDAYQTIPFASPYAAVGPANYLVCVQYDSATARYNTHTLGTDPCIVQTGTTYGTMPTVSPLPTAFVTNVGNIMSFY
jgi:hypothetical protein